MRKFFLLITFVRYIPEVLVALLVLVGRLGLFLVLLRVLFCDGILSVLVVLWLDQDGITLGICVVL
jgi:hypothetical protein